MSDESASKISYHDLSAPGIVHDDQNCVCRQGKVVLEPTSLADNACWSCGGVMVRTGTCFTCTKCGNTGGCG